MRKFLIATTVFIALSSTAFAAGKPPEVAGLVKAEAPYGQGSLSRLMITAYDATLWTDATPWSYDAPFALTLVYRMGFTTEEIVDRSIAEMERNGKLSAEQETQYKAWLTAAIPNVKDGDRITALYMPKKGIAFTHNGKPTKSVPSPEFAKRFLDIWMSEKTSEPSLRRGLLASGN